MEATSKLILYATTYTSDELTSKKLGMRPLFHQLKWNTFGNACVERGCWPL